MKHAACLYALAVLAVAPVFAQTSSSSSSAPPHFAPAPPPPGMNDPGVDPSKAPPPAPESSTALPASSPAELEPSHMAGKPIPMPSVPGAPASKDANGDDAPDVSVRKEGDNTIQEYRSNGKVYMVVVTPKFGPQQIYNVDPDGRVTGQNGQPPIKPVMYKIMQWGGSKPASASSSEDSGS
ncbi:DUF2782 domain-containing protein [Dyella caseinilytica]|nr:DUF2782 domain-containing protein [Dyella caseinilytica]GFZ91905.1 hypothetical protein GCM10011408_09180 [Dyella caseinilytica]